MNRRQLLLGSAAVIGAGAMPALTKADTNGGCQTPLCRRLERATKIAASPPLWHYVAVFVVGGLILLPFVAAAFALIELLTRPRGDS